MGSEIHIAFGCTVLRPVREVDRKSYTVVGSGEGILSLVVVKGKNDGYAGRKVHPCTGTEALYRPYGPQGE